MKSAGIPPLRVRILSPILLLRDTRASKAWLLRELMAAWQGYKRGTLLRKSKSFLPAPSTSSDEQSHVHCGWGTVY